MWWNYSRAVQNSEGLCHQGVAFNMSANPEDIAVATWKRSIFIPVSKKDSTKECSNRQTVEIIPHTNKVILKILHVRLQHYVNQELPAVQARFGKERGTRDQISNALWIIEKAREFQKKKKIYLCFIDYIKALTVWIIINCGKLLKR